MSQSTVNYLSELLKILDDTVEKNGFEGYDPRLLWYLPAARLFHKTPSSLTNFLRKVEVAAYRGVPFLIKPYLRLSNIPQVVSPYGLGLLITAYVNYYYIFKDEVYLDKAKAVEKNLRSLLVKTKSGFWGVPTPLEDKDVFSLPAGGEVGLGYLALYKATNEKVFLDYAKKIANSFIHDHQIKKINEGQICIDYYSNNDGMHVLNANALAAEVMFKVDEYSNEKNFTSYVSKIINYIRPYLYYEQLPYAGLEDKYSKKVKWSVYDVYHTGFVLRALHYIALATNDTELSNVLSEQYFKMRKNFISDFKIVETPNRDVVDIHGVAEYIRTSAVFDDSSELTRKVILHNISIMFKNNSFYYRKAKTNIYLYMPRWGHFPMMLAISSVLLRLDNSSG